MGLCPYEAESQQARLPPLATVKGYSCSGRSTGLLRVSSERNFHHRLFAAAALAIFLPTTFAGVEPFPKAFHTQEIATNGTTLHVRVGGSGPAVVLLHGFGDTGDMWSPLAAVSGQKSYGRSSLTLRGMGLSGHPDTGYDKKNQALDIVGVMDALKLQQAALVTHDIGDMVGYALAAQFPARVTRWVVIDAPLPGIGDWDNILLSPLLWHFNFRGPDEERLVQSRERIYLDRFWNELSADPKTIDRRNPATLRRPVCTATCDARCLRAVRRIQPGCVGQ